MKKVLLEVLLELLLVDELKPVNASPKCFDAKRPALCACAAMGLPACRTIVIMSASLHAAKIMAGRQTSTRAVRGY